MWGGVDEHLYPKRRESYKTIRRSQTLFRTAAGWELYAQSSLAKWMLFFNVLGAISHGVGIALTLSYARHSFRLQVYRLLPVNWGNATNVAIGFNFVADGWVYPTWVVVSFFGLSFAFHAVISLVLVAQLSWGPSMLTNWYMKGLYYGVAFWRWLEYFCSASLMIYITCLLLGLRQQHVMWLVTGLMAITITFGWLTELHASNLIERLEKPVMMCGWELHRRWLPGSWKTRMQMHLMGYLPYALLWTVVFDRFRINMEIVKDAVPEFVNSATIGSFVLFTIFGLVQFANQLFPYGPSVYWMGEATYVILSFAAKANLGFLVVFQALVPGSPYDDALAVVAGVPF